MKFQIRRILSTLILIIVLHQALHSVLRTTRNSVELEREVENFKDRLVFKSTEKTILIWNEGFASKKHSFGINFGGPEVFEWMKCQVSQCRVTEDKKWLPRIADYDAIVFNMHGRGLETEFQLPHDRSANQRYIFFAHETPDTAGVSPIITKMNTMFNWTLTYRRDSDFEFPPLSLFVEAIPGKSHPSDGNALKLFIKDYGMKNKGQVGKQGSVLKAFWFVSHCDAKSKRMEFVREMQKYMQVDIYGKCGQDVCAKQNLSCFPKIASEYKFYLSFENSLCRDYVTEKLFRIFKLNTDVLPVVFGGANYSQFAPPHSVVNAMDFEKAKDLVSHLKLLNDHDELFVEHFWWKRFYRVSIKRPYCDICKRLHDPAEPEKTYSNITDWWVGQSRCFVRNNF